MYYPSSSVAVDEIFRLYGLFEEIRFADLWVIFETLTEQINIVRFSEVINHLLGTFLLLFINHNAFLPI